MADWRGLAHRGIDELEALDIQLLLDHRVTAVDPTRQRVEFSADGRRGSLDYDRLLIATGARPRRPPIDGLDALGPADGVHVLHTMPDTFALEQTLCGVRDGSTAVIIGAGYVGLEMAEALRVRGLRVIVVEQVARCCSGPSTRS